MFGIFAALAEFERELIRERTVAGLKAARARGRKGGRKFALSKAQVRLAQAAMAHRDTSVRRDPDDEGVDEAVAAGRGRLLGHPADGVLVEPEPHLAAVRIEPGPEPEDPPVRFPDGVVRRQGPGSVGPVLARPLDDDRQLAVHGPNHGR